MRDFSDSVLDSAHAALTGGRVTQDETVPTVWWVRSSSPSPDAATYRVQVDNLTAPTWATCSCAHGLNHGGEARCHHVAAALLSIKETE